MATVLISILLLFLSSRHRWTRNGLRLRLCQRFQPLEQSQESRKRKEGFTCFVSLPPLNSSHPSFPPVTLHFQFSVFSLTSLQPQKSLLPFTLKVQRNPPNEVSMPTKNLQLIQTVKAVHWLEASVCNNLQGPSIHHWAPLTHSHNNCKIKVTSISLSLASYFRWFPWQLLRRENNSPRSKGTWVWYPRIYSKRYI